MKRVVIVSPYFPPSALAGVHRARLLAKYLPACGWEPVVICVHERFYEQAPDPDLALLIPPQLKIIKTGAVPVRIARPFGIGDISLRGYFHIRNALSRFLEREGADLLFITMSPYYTSLLGSYVKKRFRLPFILDYQDPWTSKWGAEQLCFSKAGLAHMLGAVLEPRVIRDADHITSVSEGTNEAIRARYSGLPRGRFTAIPIGGDPEDYEYLDQHPKERATRLLDSKHVNFCCVGTFPPRAGQTLEALLSSISRIRETDPELFGKMRFYFVGTSNQPNGHMSFKVLPAAKTHGLESVITEIPERIPYLEALTLLRKADVIFALGSDEAHYTASRLYPTLMSGRPALVVFHEKSSLCGIANRIGGCLLVEFSDECPVMTRVSAIQEALTRLARNPAAVPAARAGELEAYTARAIAVKFAAIFQKVVTEFHERLK